MFGKTADQFRASITAARIDIYAPIDPDDPELFIPTEVLEELLDRGLKGLNLDGLSPRTRSKVVKEAACRALGYPVPKSFVKCQPRFTGQDFDTYNQQALNLQIWNEPINPSRRYALVRIGSDGVVRQVKVVLGEALIPLDTTGRLTTKYQAQMIRGPSTLNLLSSSDTRPIVPFLSGGDAFRNGFDVNTSPAGQPVAGQLFSIAEIFFRLSFLIGRSFPDVGRQQDRARGEQLHRLVCQVLGYSNYQDNGQFPDIRHQLLEVKLQTSPTIDLGLVLPESIGAVKGVHGLGNVQPRHCDTRYALFTASVSNGLVHLTHLYVVTGEEFFQHFRQFQGLTQNKKIQIPLPSSLFRS